MSVPCECCALLEFSALDHPSGAVLRRMMCLCEFSKFRERTDHDRITGRSATGRKERNIVDFQNVK